MIGSELQIFFAEYSWFKLDQEMVLNIVNKLKVVEILFNFDSMNKKDMTRVWWVWFFLN
jgi:hypothetical protein